jgi:hypothetical protein
VDETTARVELQADPGRAFASDSDSPDAPDPSDALEPLGAVTLEALGRLMRRFERIDAFSTTQSSSADDRS